jgi:hypothetical protein
MVGYIVGWVMAKMRMLGIRRDDKEVLGNAASPLAAWRQAPCVPSPSPSAFHQGEQILLYF